MKVGHWYSFEKHSSRKKNNAWGRRQRYSGKRRSLIEIRQPPQQNNTVKSIFKWLHRWWNPHWQRRCKMLEKNSIYDDDVSVVPLRKEEEYTRKKNARGRRQRYSGKRSPIESRRPPQNPVKSTFKWLHRWWTLHWQRRCKMLEKNSIYNDDERVVPVKHPMLILHWWRMMEWWYYFKRPLHWRRRCMST